MVTHYAEPIGYVFGRNYLSSSGRSDPPGSFGFATARKSASRADCAGLSCLSSGNFQAPALTAPRSLGTGAEGGEAPVLSIESGAFESSGSLVGVISHVLEHEPGELERVRGSGTCERSSRGTG